MERRARTGAPPKVHAPSVVMPGARLEVDTVVGAFCFIASGAVLGRGTRLQSHISVWDGVILGEDVFVGPAAMFTNVRHPRAAFPRRPSEKYVIAVDGSEAEDASDGNPSSPTSPSPNTTSWDTTHVDDGASIGANATIVAPVRIGRSAMIGAAAVVTRDVPPHAIVVGAPARIAGWACTCGETISRARSTCPASASCDRCGRQFVKDDARGGLTEERRP